MNTYKITGYSRCGTYFASYLQSVTILANSKEEALAVYKKWSKKEYSFEKGIIPDVELISMGSDIPQVIDYLHDSDY